VSLALLFFLRLALTVFDLGKTMLEKDACICGLFVGLGAYVYLDVVLSKYYCNLVSDLRHPVWRR